MFNFEAPFYLFFLLFLPLLIYLRHFWNKRAGALPFTVNVYKGEKFQAPGSFYNLILFILAVFFWLGAALIIIAAAGPASVRTEKKFYEKGMDIVFVLDESPTMAAMDFQPGNRFEMARNLINSFADSRENDALGLVTFGREAALRVPPTLDYAAFKKTLAGLELNSLGDGTAIGMGLAVACLHLQKTEPGKGVIILLTDGKNNAGEIAPLAAGELASVMGLRVYAIGIGSNDEVPIEYFDRDKNRIVSGFLRDGYDEDSLRKLSAVSGGEFFTAAAPGALEKAFEKINALESGNRKSRIVIVSEKKSWLFALWGLLLISFDFFIRKYFFSEIL